MQIGAATVENSMEGSQKLKIKLPYDLAIPLLGIGFKKMKTLFQKETHTPMFIAALFTVAEAQKQP